eukprot:Colp12_sorted_trinity150504_noHs@23954
MGSFLQRLAEDCEYTQILDVAAGMESSLERLAYVAAFTVSSYSTTPTRTTKPFNPILGETFELNRPDLGFRLIAEQVCHHPPVAAFHARGNDWIFEEGFSMNSKFRGKYLQVTPTGMSRVTFTKLNEVYTWKKVTTTIHNIIIGKLWIDQSGDMEILSSNGEKCVLKYYEYSYMNSDRQRRVEGKVYDKNGKAAFDVYGRWDEKIEFKPSSNSDATPVLAWQRHEFPTDTDKMYGFTTFACQLNQFEPGTAPTDSRCRPDQRLMEEGDWELANAEKLRLEEKQRTMRKQREQEGVEYKPRWFQQVSSDDINDWKYKGGYWENKQSGRWEDVPDIFS